MSRSGRWRCRCGGRAGRSRRVCGHTRMKGRRRAGRSGRQRGRGVRDHRRCGGRRNGRRMGGGRRSSAATTHTQVEVMRWDRSRNRQAHVSTNLVVWTTQRGGSARLQLPRPPSHTCESPVATAHRVGAWIRMEWECRGARSSFGRFYRVQCGGYLGVRYQHHCIADNTKVSQARLLSMPRQKLAR